jgi:hypothetical protein
MCKVFEGGLVVHGAEIRGIRDITFGHAEGGGDEVRDVGVVLFWDTASVMNVD